MANEIVGPDAPDSEEADWLALLRDSSGDRPRDAIQKPGRPLLVRAGYPGFIVPESFPVSMKEGNSFPAMVIHIETDAMISASMLGELLIRIERGARRRVRRYELDTFQMHVAELRTGSYFLKVVIPVAGLMFSFGSLLNDLYATFTENKAAQRPAVTAITNIALVDGVRAVTLYSNDGLAVRVDRSSANAYVEHNDTKPVLPSPPPPRLPAQAPEHLKPPALLGTEIAGSGRIFLIDGTPYVRIQGKEGALVAIEDLRESALKFESGDEYNLVGTFDLDEDRFPQRFVLVDARRLK